MENMLKVRKLLIETFVFLFVIVININILRAEEQCYFMTVTKNVEYKDTWLLQWDPANPEEINPSTSVNVKVIGGWKKFTWSVSGEDFWFDSAQTITSIETDSKTVTLYAGSNACGPANIVVADSRDGSVTGSLRCTNGQWVLISTGVCEMPGQLTKSHWVGGYCERISGKGWQKQWICSDGDQVQGYYECPYDCDSDGFCDNGLDSCHEIQTCLTGNWRVDSKCWFDINTRHIYCYCLRDFEYWEWKCP